MAQTLANITVKPSTVTWNSTELGYTQGDIQFSFEEQAVDITTHQTGTEILDKIRTGTNIEMTVTLLETSATQLQTLLEIGGGSNTPGGGTKVSGWGSSQRFTGMLADSQKLVISPLGAVDETGDFGAWKAYPMLSSITISSENPRNVELTFHIFEDSAKVAAVNKFFFGDHTQDLDA
jgi:hypothetical protein